MPKGKNAPRKQQKNQITKEPPSFIRWFFGHIFSVLRRHGNTVGFWIGMGYIARQASLAFIAYAGKQSNASLALSLMRNVNFVFTGSIAISGLSVSLYLRERSLHRSTRKRLASRITELEIRIDPSRTSSRLTEEGLTRRGDE
ncbi:MAG TPA: hypothetical protein VMH80_20110 [Bryobacteraceae bacterium]|nr:hypothetical protein [Bryobacteraceae bacterium]